jgi:mono/diheme cytochrome c family protein
MFGVLWASAGLSGYWHMFSPGKHLCCFWIGFAGLANLAPAQVRDARGYPAPTVALERGRAVYVTSSCHFCHGIDLTGAAMGAANLMTSQLLGRDQGGNLIGAVVRAGLPNLQTAMPQYADYTDEQIADLAAYVHYLRQQGRYKELMAEKDQGTGDPASGRQNFNGPGNCASCHSPTKDLVGIGSRYEAGELRARLLRPGVAFVQNCTAGSDLTHLKLLQNYRNEDVRNLVAYLSTIR